TREYYFNDSGAQVEKLGLTVLALKHGEPIPEDGYHGDYVGPLAANLPPDVWQKAESEPDRAGWILGDWASEQIRVGIEQSLANLGVKFDHWKSEGSLHTEGHVSRAIDKLRASGDVYEQDGALWFRSTAYGDDKDRVVIRSNGEPTYFASDIGYVSEKFGRGFDELIYVWGADHHGTVARLKNAAQALGLNRDATNVLLIAWVHFVRDGVEVSMSKRTGEFVTLDELLAEVGVDAARWFFASRAPTTGIDFDIELAKKESSENPVYYVQYAHARISSILRKAAAEGLKTADSLTGGLADDPVALGLAKDLLRLPDIVRDAAQEQETQSITAFATELATTLHAFYRDRRVVDATDPVTSGYRLALVDSTRVTLAAALALLGISAPDQM
ncbi:MAG: arginine--tRNA ligase, partial [Chloroflexota bacterium]